MDGLSTIGTFGDGTNSLFVISRLAQTAFILYETPTDQDTNNEKKRDSTHTFVPFLMPKTFES